MGPPAGPQSVYPQPSDGMGGPHGRYDIVNFFGQAGSDIASQFVANNTNTITYVETAYAIEHNLPCAAMENQRGNFIQPSPTSTAAALKGAKLLPDTSPDLGSIFESPHANAYPISDYSFALTHTSGV